MLVKDQGNSLKRKKEAQDVPIANNEEDGDQSPLKKHKSLLLKFEKASRLADRTRNAPKLDVSETAEKSPTPELHDLVPIPQPAPIPEPQYAPTFSTLPSWLTQPITISSTATKPFSQLNIGPRILEQLSQRGIKEAFAVQAAVLPLLMPGPEQHAGDICVSAATGSGKSLSYILPIIENLKTPAVTKLRAVIVVPTRELVFQAKEVAEQYSAGTGLKIGTAVGNHSLTLEQELLIKTRSKYNPEAYARMQKELNDRLLSGSTKRDKRVEDSIRILPDHIPVYESKVDILICTPGRLVEHIKSTHGFTLDDIRWLVIDEADRLLDQSFQEWVEAVITPLQTEKLPDQLGPRGKILTKLEYPVERRHITKVILSATMTRDLTKLGSLKLRRPRLVIVETASETLVLSNDNPSGIKSHSSNSEAIFDLPNTLKEYAVAVGSGADKPLYLLKLLEEIIPQNKFDHDQQSIALEKDGTSDDSDSDVSNSRDEESSVVSSSTDTEDESDDHSGTSDSDDNSSASSSSENDTPKTISSSKSRFPVNSSNVLVFTNNNENASRLSYLLQLLHPPFAKAIGTLTKSSATSTSRRTLKEFQTGKISILIASDRASRGLDVPNLSHIINYDLPRNTTDYVHRVGRTARAGRTGDAWTFFTKTEGRWFWNAIAKAPEIKREARKVMRKDIGMKEVASERRKAYEAALQELQAAVKK